MVALPTDLGPLQPSFDAAVHLHQHVGECDEHVQALANALQALHPNLAQSEESRQFCTKETMVRFLIARNFDVQAACEMLAEALKWRVRRSPSVLRAAEFEHEARTGKIYIPGKDQWGRPIMVFDNSVQNTTDVENQMRFLAWNLEFLIREMEVDANRDKFVDKYLIFMHLENFSFLNMPPFKATRETITMLTTCYPERLGHCILYKPPAIFKTFFNSMKALLDPKTAAKLVFITGDTSVGSANDVTLCSLIGPHWRDTTGAEKEIVEAGCSPGYDHKTQWKKVLEREAIHLGLHTSENPAANSAEMASLSEQKVPDSTAEKSANTAVPKREKRPKQLTSAVLLGLLAVLVGILRFRHPEVVSLAYVCSCWRQGLLLLVIAIAAVIFAHKDGQRRGSSVYKVLHSRNSQNGVEVLVTSDPNFEKYVKIVPE